jgi:hypothetical protein
MILSDGGIISLVLNAARGRGDIVIAVDITLGLFSDEGSIPASGYVTGHPTLPRIT